MLVMESGWGGVERRRDEEDNRSLSRSMIVKKVAGAQTRVCSVHQIQVLVGNLQ
jgi:hypothetical protein